MRPQWQSDLLTKMDWHVLVLLAVMAVVGLVTRLLMNWAEKRWNSDTVKKRRLPR
jgi:membrane protein required for beta-lactamase induction